MISRLGSQDSDAISVLARKIWHAHYPAIITTAQIDYMLAQRYTPEALRESLKNSFWFGAWEDTGKPDLRLIGFAQCFPEASPSTWKLDKLYIDPAMQRQGIGRQLLGRVCRQVLDADANRLVLRVNRHNHIALAAYARYGFQITGEDVLDIGNGFVMDDYLLELILPIHRQYSVDLAT